MARPPVTFRTAVPSDARAMALVDERSWPAALATNAARMLARVLAYPEGQWVAESQGRIVAVSSAQRIDEEDLRTKTASYAEITDDDRFAATHRPEGTVHQLVGVGVLPEFRGDDLGRQLVDRQIAMALADPRVTRIVGFTRPVGFARFAARTGGTLDEYLAQRTPEGRCIDPVVAFHVDAGARIVSLHEGFRPADVDTCGASVLIEYPVAR